MSITYEKSSKSDNEKHEKSFHPDGFTTGNHTPAAWLQLHLGKFMFGEKTQLLCQQIGFYFHFFGQKSL